MAPQGQYTRSRHCFLGLVVAVVATMLISMALFREELLSAFRTLQPPACSCPAADPAVVYPASGMHSAHHGHGKVNVEEGKHGGSTKEHQRLVPTTFADLTILEDLAPANVLWVNETGSGPEAWGISMFHALHCVKMWKETLDPATTMASHVHSESEYAEHAGHCINYLVQSIMCAADDTIEPAEDVVDGDRHGRRIHGMGYQHQCRDPGLLFEMNGKAVDPWGWKQGDTLHSVFG